MSRKLISPRQDDQPATSDKGNQQERTKVEGGADGPAQPDPSRVDAKDTDTKWRKVLEWWKPRYKSLEWWKPRLEIVGIVFAVLYAIVTYRQWQDAKTNFETDQRAWISVEVGKTIDAVETADTFSFRGVEAPLRNTGKTPALNVSLQSIIVSRISTHRIPEFDSHMAEITPEGLKLLHENWAEFQRKFPAFALMNGPFVHFKGGVMAPNEIDEMSLTGVKGYTKTRADDVGLAPSDRGVPRYIYILGKVTYNDIFPKTSIHSTKFCLVRTGGLAFVKCPEANWMD